MRKRAWFGMEVACRTPSAFSTKLAVHVLCFWVAQCFVRAWVWFQQKIDAMLDDESWFLAVADTPQNDQKKTRVYPGFFVGVA